MESCFIEFLFKIVDHILYACKKTEKNCVNYYMHRLDKLSIPEDTRKYLRDTVNPILEDMLTHVLMDRPTDAAEYMYEYLGAKLNRSSPKIPEQVCIQIPLFYV